MYYDVFEKTEAHERSTSHAPPRFLRYSIFSPLPEFLGHIPDVFPFAECFLYVHSLIYRVSSDSVYRLDFFHPRAGQLISAHCHKSCNPCNHRHNAEQKNYQNMHSFRVWRCTIRQFGQADCGNCQTDYRRAKGAHQFVYQRKQCSDDSRDIPSGPECLVI